MRFSPNTANPIIVSAGWDKIVKVKTFFVAFYLSWNKVVEGDMRKLKITEDMAEDRKQWS